MVNKMEEKAYSETKIDKPEWDREETPLTKAAVDNSLQIPEHLKCPVCSELLRDAVMMPCCAGLACDECARDALIKEENVKHECPICGESDNSPDDLIPVRQTREEVKKFLNSNQSFFNPGPHPDSESTPKKPEVRPTLPDIPLPNLNTVDGKFDALAFQTSQKAATAPPTAPGLGPGPFRPTPPGSRDGTPSANSSPYSESASQGKEEPDRQKSPMLPQHSRVSNGSPLKDGSVPNDRIGSPEPRVPGVDCKDDANDRKTEEGNLSKPRPLFENGSGTHLGHGLPVTLPTSLPTHAPPLMYSAPPPHHIPPPDYGRPPPARGPPHIIDDPLAAFQSYIRKKESRSKYNRGRYARSRSRSRSPPPFHRSGGYHGRRRSPPSHYKSHYGRYGSPSRYRDGSPIERRAPPPPRGPRTPPSPSRRLAGSPRSRSNSPSRRRSPPDRRRDSPSSRRRTPPPGEGSPRHYTAEHNSKLEGRRSRSGSANSHDRTPSLSPEPSFNSRKSQPHPRLSPRDYERPRFHEADRRRRDRYIDEVPPPPKAYEDGTIHRESDGHGFIRRRKSRTPERQSTRDRVRDDRKSPPKDMTSKSSREKMSSELAEPSQDKKASRKEKKRAKDRKKKRKHEGDPSDSESPPSETEVVKKKTKKVKKVKTKPAPTEEVAQEERGQKEPEALPEEPVAPLTDPPIEKPPADVQTSDATAVPEVPEDTVKPEENGGDDDDEDDDTLTVSLPEPSKWERSDEEQDSQEEVKEDLRDVLSANKLEKTNAKKDEATGEEGEEDKKKKKKKAKKAKLAKSDSEEEGTKKVKKKKKKKEKEEKKLKKLLAEKRSNLDPDIISGLLAVLNADPKKVAEVMSKAKSRRQSPPERSRRSRSRHRSPRRNVVAGQETIKVTVGGGRDEDKSPRSGRRVTTKRRHRSRSRSSSQARVQGYGDKKKSVKDRLGPVTSEPKKKKDKPSFKNEHWSSSERKSKPGRSERNGERR